MLKFRTMESGAEERIGQYLGAELMQANDAELTAIGRWLKASQLDEIPQLWNVLRGDMSFVGPRPIRPRFFAELAQDLPAYWQRLVVRPGLTGFAQVRGRLRDVDGREARPRPRVDRRPLRAPLSAHDRRHGCPGAAARSSRAVPRLDLSCAGSAASPQAVVPSTRIASRGWQQRCIIAGRIRRAATSTAPSESRRGGSRSST